MKIRKEGNDTARVYLTETGTVWGATKLNEVMWMLGVIQNPSLEEAREMLDYIWEDTGATKFIAFLPADKELRGMTKKLGFKQEGRLKNASLAGDLLVLGQYR
jgi:hypothetical protein